MRFFKIFLVALASLIGSLGLILGVMYLAGSFNEKQVAPEAIYFELGQDETAFNFATDGTIKIQTTTEDVTQTEITLSLPNAQTSQVDGITYITNGIIKVPKFVALGQSFKVELIKAPNAALDGEEWIVGGVSTLTAKSESLLASQISVDINVDVPVKNIEIITYANDTFTQPVSTFAAGETFYAKANFLPVESAYKFSQNGENGLPVQMKSVFFDVISTSNCVAENTTINANLAAQGITNIKAFDATSATDDLSINGYVFENAALEQACLAENGDNVDAILAELKSSATSLSAKKEIELKNLAIRSFTIAENLTTKTLTFNRTNKIFANFGEVASALNFGINISDSADGTPTLQSKIKNVGLKVMYKAGADAYLPADENQFLIVDNLGAKKSPQNGYYLPNVVVADVNQSYWNFVPLQANLNFAFELCILNDDGAPDESINAINTFTSGSMQTWQSAGVIASNASWTTSQDITLTVVDNINPTLVQSEEYDLSKILSFTAGTYSVVRYVAYTDNQDDLSALLPTCAENANYNATMLGLPANTRIFELATPTIKLLPSQIASFKVKAVVLKSDYLGRLDPAYSIFSQTDALTINVNKTVKNLSAKIFLGNSSLLKNIATDEPLSRLAFVYGTGDNIFDIVFTVEAENKTALDFEKEIFLNDFAAGKIRIIDYIPGEQQSVVTHTSGVGEYISETQWQYSISYFSGNGSRDTEIRFDFAYQQTDLISFTQPIKAVEFSGEDAGFADASFDATAQSVLIVLYDGKIFTLEFAYDNDETSPIQQRTTITGNEGCGTDAIFAQSVDRQYYLGQDPLEDVVDEITGKFLITAKDKFGNEVSAANCTYEPKAGYYLLSTSEYSSALSTPPTDKLFFVEDNDLSTVSVGANVGTIELGVWVPSEIENGFNALSQSQSATEIAINRVGINGGKIQITGDEGLLSVRFTTEGQTWELCNILKYTFASSFDAYEGVLAYDETTGAISILKTLGKEISLDITATAPLGLQYSIKLTIQQNISVQLNRITPQGTLEEAGMIGGVQHYLLYSDNDVHYALKVTYVLNEQVDFELSNGLFTNGESIIRPAPSFTQASNGAETTLEFVLSFTKAQLNAQTITLSAGSGSSYVFKQDFQMFVSANAAFKGNVETITKSVVIEDLTSTYDVITADDIQRIVGQNTITLQDFTITFAKTTDGTLKDLVFQNGNQSPLASNIFVWDNNSKKIKARVAMIANFDLDGEYVAYLNVRYGTATVGTIKVMISTSVAPNTQGLDFDKRFAMYDGKLYLVLQSGETGITGAYIQSLFNNVEEIDFVVDNNFITANDNANFTVKAVSNFVDLANHNVSLKLKHIAPDLSTVAEITFGVLIAPYDTAFVKYQTPPMFEGASLGVQDFSSLNDFSLLYQFNAFDEYKSGEQANLFATNGKTYGLSQTVLSKLKDGTFTYQILMQGASGEITDVEYQGIFNKNTGILTTIPSSDDEFVYFAIYEDVKQENLIGLYRIKLVANSAINVYYPFANGALEETEVLAEYVYEDVNNPEKVINFDEVFAQNLPNAGHKRVQLDVWNEDKNGYEETNQTYQIKYTLFKVDNQLAAGQLGTIKTNYGIWLDGANLNIVCQGDATRQFNIVVQCDVKMGSIEIGTTHYTITLNSTEKSLYELKLGADDYTTKTQTIQKGEVFDFANIKLYKTEGAISSPALDVELGTHYYIDNKTAGDFITENNKTLGLKDTAVSDKLVHFTFFTKYGALHTMAITFVSDYSATLATPNVLTQNAVGHLEVLADTEFSLKKVFEISNANGKIDLANVDFEYYIDNQKFVGENVVFNQIPTDSQTLTLKVVAKLGDAGIGAAEDYVFEHQIDVLQSIKSNFASAPLALGEVPYASQYKTDGLAFNKLLSTAFTDENFLFESANANVLSGYAMAVNIDANAFGYASLSSAENLLSKTYSSQEFLAMATDAKIYLLKSPNQDKCTINISFILTKTNADGTTSNIESKLKFVLAPDIEVAFTYPQANANSNLDSEHIFLASDYFNGGNTLTFDFAGEGAAYFGTTRTSFDSAQTIDDARIQIRATSQGQNILIDGALSTTKSLSSTFDICWNTTSAFAGAMSGTVNFEVLIDGVSHGAYVIVFNNNIESIFAISHLKNLYQNGEDNTAANPEQFFVDTASTEAIFSHKTAMLSFTNQVQQENITLIAYAKNESGAKEEIGTITIGQTRATHNWILKAKNQNIAEDLSNVVIVVKGEPKEYTFSQINGDENSVYHYDNFFEKTATLTYRLGATYLGQELAYENLLSLVDIKFGNQNGEPNTFAIARKTAQSGNVQFAINGQSLSTAYHFEVVYDFKATNAFSTALGQTTGNPVQELAAPASISGKTAALANNAFGISGLSEAFNAEYFTKHNVEYFAQIVMITNSAFESAPTQENVKFLAADKLWFMQQYFDGITAAKSAVLCAGITLKEDAGTGNTYDFDLSAFGAENDGNFVYILVSYGTDESARGTITSTNVSKFAFALVKVKILPNNASIQLFNTDGLLNGESEESNQIITYTDEKFDDILLGTYGATLADKNLIYIFGTGASNLICDSTGNHPMTISLVGDIAHYADIPATSSSSLYLKQKPGTVAMYGDKTGYIHITDMYGFEKKYYITIKAANTEDALALVSNDEGGTFVNTIAGTQNSFFTAAEIVLIDADAEFKSTELGAIKVYNFAKLINKVKNSMVGNTWSFQVSFAIPSLNFRADNAEFNGTEDPQTTLVLPSITADNKTVELFILITVNHNETTEVITLGTTIEIQKRFKLANTADEKASVQAGVAFDVSKYLSVTDEANLGTNLGSASVSENTLTLRVSAANEFAGKAITINALHNDDITLSLSNINIFVGRTFDDQAMTATNGYYYYQLANHPALVGKNFADFTFTVSSTEINVANACQFVADKIISLTTSNVAPETTVYVHINNGENAFAVPFALNKNGVQTKSLCEITAAGKLATSVGYNIATENLPQIQTLGTSGVVIGQSEIFKFALASTPVKADELQTIKGFVVYNDSLELQINKPNGVEDLTQVEFVVTISCGGEMLGSKLYSITENAPHFRFISVFEIIGTASIGEEYDVSITYTLAANSVPSIITLNGTAASYKKQENFGYQYALSSTFEFTEIAAGKTEVLNVLTKDAFTNRIYKTSKYYLVQYLKQNTYESAKISFNVTPKYYGLDTENSVLDKTVYANQYTALNGQYVIDFNTWASGFNLVNLAGETLATLASEQTLVFKINDGEGQGSGAATLDQAGTLTTTNKYQEGQYFVIEVWVPVVEGEEICIGSIKLRIIHSQVYVATLSTYMFIITFPGDWETIEPSYTFTKNVTELSELIFNNPAPQLQGKVDPASQTIMIGGVARNIADCNIEIVTVVEQIYSAEYVVKNNAEYLQLKMKLNETSSTAGKTVELQIDATSKSGAITAESKFVSLAIQKAAGNDLAFDITAGAGTLCTRENGIYIVDIPFANIYSSIIGEDFNYEVKVLDTTTTSAELLYAKRAQSQSEFTLNDTLYFALSFVDSVGEEHYTILGTKYTNSNTQLFETEGFFTLNIKNLSTIDGFQVLTENNGEYTSNVSCYSIKYLGTYDFNLSAGNNILISSQNGAEQYLSVAKVISYNTDGAFEVSINSKEIYDQVISSNSTIVLSEYTEEVYTDTQTGYHLPKVVSLATVANGYSMFSLCTSDITQNKIVGIKSPTSKTNVVIDYAWFNATAPSVMIVDITNNVSATDLQTVSFFKQTGPYQVAIAKANIEISTIGTYTQYVFDSNILDRAVYATQIDTINLSTLVPNVQANGVYAFGVEGENQTYFALAANANGEVIVNLADVLTGESGVYVFTYQNITLTALPSGTETFALYDESGNLISAKSIAIVQNNGIAKWAQDVLWGAKSAVQTNSVSLDIAAQTMTYITTSQSGTKTFDAVYLDAAGKFEIDLSSLAAGQTLEIAFSTNGFTGFGASDELSITITAAEVDKTFNISADGEITSVVIPKNQTNIVVSATTLNITTTANNLTILPS